MFQWLHRFLKTRHPLWSSGRHLLRSVNGEHGVDGREPLPANRCSSEQVAVRGPEATRCPRVSGQRRSQWREKKIQFYTLKPKSTDRTGFINMTYVASTFLSAQTW